MATNSPKQLASILPAFILIGLTPASGPGTLNIPAPRSSLLAPNRAAPKTWFGPQVVSFNIQYAGNPYDPTANDVKVKFTNDNGFAIERPAYFDHGAWRAVLVAPLSGRYKSVLYHNGRASLEEAVPLVAELNTRPPHGFVVRDNAYSNRFDYDDGSLIFPIGFNLGRQNHNGSPIEDEIKTIGDSGLNWTKIWPDGFDGMNPWRPSNDPFAIKDQLWPKALDRWTSLIADCDGSGINYQFVLFDGRFLGSEWADNPWNVSNGGFLRTPDEFFTNPEAKRREKMWLRYAAARWGADSFLFGWELMADAEVASSNLAAWLKEMAAYLRSVDPYGHLITASSSNHDLPLDSLDYSQEGPSSDLPNFISEVDTRADLGPRDERQFLRSEIWDSIRRNSSATAMYAHWDRIESDDLLPEFRIWAQIIGESNLAQHSMAKGVDVRTTTGRAQGLRDINWTLIRLENAKGRTPKLAWPGMIAGSWEITSYDLDTGQTEKEVDAASETAIQMGKIRGSDVVLVFRTAEG